MNKFIVIEGLSGSGKTTIATGLAKKINGIYLKTPIPPFDKIRSEVDKLNSLDAKSLFYLAGLVDLSEKIPELLKENHVIVDKYFDSLLIYRKLRGLNFNIPDWVKIRKPDHAFLIVSDEPSRIMGLIDRGSDLDLNEHIGPEKVDKLISLYKQNKELVEIDNSGSVDTAVADIIKRAGLEELRIKPENSIKLK